MRADVVQKVKLHNRFDIKVRDARTGEIKKEAYAENIILDNLWNELLTDAFFIYIMIGTGAGTLSASRTTLFNHLAYLVPEAPEYTNMLESEDWFSARRSVTIDETEYNGNTISEIGVGSDGGTTIHTHALLKDMNGNPTTITKTNTDIVTFYATVYAHFEAHAWLNGKARVLYPMVVNEHLMHAMVGQSNILAGDSRNKLVFGGGRSPSGHQYFDFTQTYFSTNFDYGARQFVTPGRSQDTANKKVTFSARCPVDDCNSDLGINSVALLLGTSYDQYLVAWCSFPFTGFTASSIASESLGSGDGLTTDFVSAFPLLINNANLKVYIDGVQKTSGLTIHTGKPNSDDITFLMRMLDAFTTDDIGRSAAPLIGCDADTVGFADGWVTWENTAYATVPIKSLLTGNGNRIYTSDDGESWGLAATSTSSTAQTSIPAGHQGKQYWKVTGRESDDVMTGGVRNFLNGDYSSFKNVVFDTAPGAISDESVGTGDGSTVEFTLSHEPIAGSLTVYLDDVETTDYTEDSGVITFNTAPGSGVVITADFRYACDITIDYDTEVVAKDSDHVFDFSLSLQFGEYTPS